MQPPSRRASGAGTLTSGLTECHLAWQSCLILVLGCTFQASQGHVMPRKQKEGTMIGVSIAVLCIHPCLVGILCGTELGRVLSQSCKPVLSQCTNPCSAVQAAEPDHQYIDRSK